MANSTLIKKLGIKPGYRIAILEPPAGYLERLQPLPEGVALLGRLDGVFDLIHLFARNSGTLNRLAPAAVKALRPDGLLWVSCPKKSSGVETDLTRDEGWQFLRTAAWRPVTQISIGQTWSALRFRPFEEQPAESLVAAKFSGPKASLRPIYDRMVGVVLGFGDDIEIAPRKTYVSLARLKQFAITRSSTRTRLDLGLKLKDRAYDARFVDSGSFRRGSVTHKVALYDLGDVDAELVQALQEADDGAAT